jgi:hypothetical protein
MKLYEIFDRDPRVSRLVNNGQARITDQLDDNSAAELRAELETFVCEGQFAHAIELILDRYLGNLGHTKQDSTWVSGFFGSGKSHLLKMLTHLWVNTEFGDGARARDLVRGGLPNEVEAHLKELDTQIRRTKIPAVAAAGTLLGGNDRVRETVLSIILKAKGWPAQYPQAKFCFWLAEQGWIERVRASVEGEGKDWLKELNNLYVSPLIRRALLAADPNLAVDEKGVGQILRNQFPQSTADISTDAFTTAVKQALEEDGQIPLTLVVLDEVQQYINEATDRAATITEVAEVMQTHFENRVMLVCAGQSALSAGTQALMWLRDRFKISIELADADVETVIRKVLLHKKPSALPAIEGMLEDNAGEIARHLQGTKIGEGPEDRQYRAIDYPQLPTRRRFWEACFQAADAAGTHSQLRSQLRILHDALQDVADEDLGTVLPASVLFNALAPSLVNTGVLLNEIHTRIQKLDDGAEGGRLRRDLCGLVFLINKLPHEAGVDLGVRANARMLADLMIDNISRDSGPFRKQVELSLEALAEEATLMKVGDEFRLQTTEGAEWDRAFRERQASLRQDEATIANRRDHLFAERVQRIVGEIKLSHGDAKLRRTLSLHTGAEAPTGGGDHLSVWLRNGWSTAEKDVIAEARRSGQDDPVLHVALPKRNADDLKGRIIDAEAAQRVLDRHGVPATPEGREAREGMESRLRTAERSRDEIVREIIHAAKVIQGGGNEVYGEDLREKIEAGTKDSLARLFTRFDEGDHRAWDVAVKRARDGSDQPFKAVGWDKPTEEHPVAKEVMATVGKGARGTEIQKSLKAAPFGWPQDAIDAALIALHGSGHLRAERNKSPIKIGRLDQAGIKAAEFRPERIHLTTSQKIALRGLFAKAGIETKTGDEEARARDFLNALKNLAEEAGGEPPLPKRPDPRLIDDLDRLTGNEQLSAFLDHKDDIERSIDASRRLSQRAQSRREAWDLATAFRDHAAGLKVLKDVGPELDAILGQRSLLADTDHVTPLAGKLGAALREVLNKRHRTLGDAIDTAQRRLEADATWGRLDPKIQNEILGEVGLTAPLPLETAGDQQLLQSLKSRSLSAWTAEIEATGARIAKALEQAAERLEADDPKVQTTTVAIRRGTLADEPAVRTWLKEQEETLLDAVKNGPVIVQ